MVNARCSAASDNPSVEIAMAVELSVIVEDSQHSLQQDSVPEMGSLPSGNESQDCVTIDMPPPNANPTPENVKLFGSTPDLCVGSCSSGAGSSPGLVSKCEFESGGLNMEEAAILALGGLQNVRPPVLGLSSLTGQVDTLSKARSLPTSHIQLSNLDSKDGSYITPNSNGVEGQQAFYRSRSVPVRIFRVVSNRRTPERGISLSTSPSIHSGEEHQDDITEDEAVCRICLGELGEEMESFKLECNCRGDLSLVHWECSKRWFELKGNRTCEVCMGEVQNITVRVIRTRRLAVDPSSLQNIQVQQTPLVQLTPSLQQELPMMDTDKWREFPFLAIVSISGYFIALRSFEMWREPNDKKIGIYAIPTSCILGIFTTLAAALFAQRNHMWIYGLSQYTIFSIVSQVFYNGLHYETIPTIIFSTALGIGISRSVRPLYHIFKKLRAAWRNFLNNNPQDDAPPTEAQPTQ